MKGYKRQYRQLDDEIKQKISNSSRNRPKSDQHKQRISQGMKDLRGKKAPLGYSKEGKSRETFCYLNDIGKLIRKAFKWKLNGDANATILHRLEANGLKISPQTLHKILVNPFYAGKIVHKLINGEMVDGKIEPAVSYTDFLKVQDILSGRTGKFVHSKENAKCPLTKYVICSEDGTPFTSYTKTKKTREFNYYKCNKSGCKTNVSAKEMHEKYEQMLSTYDLPETMLKEVEETYDRGRGRD